MEKKRIELSGRLYTVLIKYTLLIIYTGSKDIFVVRRT